MPKKQPHGQTQDKRDNRAAQLDPQNPRYWRARGMSEAQADNRAAQQRSTNDRKSD